MGKGYVRLINDFREPEDNEFFFEYDPRNKEEMGSMLEYLEANFSVRIEDIDSWKIRTTSKHNGNYDKYAVGLRIVRTK